VLLTLGERVDKQLGGFWTHAVRAQDLLSLWVGVLHLRVSAHLQQKLTPAKVLPGRTCNTSKAMDWSTQSWCILAAVV
jgi:hypothetical protein